MISLAGSGAALAMVVEELRARHAKLFRGFRGSGSLPLQPAGDMAELYPIAAAALLQLFAYRIGVKRDRR